MSTRPSPTRNRGLVAALLLLAAPATAQELPDVSKRNNEAIELSKEGEFAKANAIWMELSSQVAPDYPYLWAFHKNVGRNFQKLSNLPAAWWHFDRCLELTGRKQEQTAEWQSGTETNLKEMAYVRVTLQSVAGPAQVRLRIDTDGQWHKLPLTWWFRQGRNSVDARTDKGALIAVEFDVGPDTTLVGITMPPGPEPKPDKVVKPDPVVPLPPEVVTDQDDDPPWNWLLLGSSAALAAAGGVVYYCAVDSRDTQRAEFETWKQETYGLAGKVPPASQPEAESEWERRVSENVTPFEVSSYILWSAAAAAAAGSLVIWLSGGEPERGETPAVVPVATPGGLGAYVVF